MRGDSRAASLRRSDRARLRCVGGSSSRGLRLGAGFERIGRGRATRRDSARATRRWRSCRRAACLRAAGLLIKGGAARGRGGGDGRRLPRRGRHRRIGIVSGLAAGGVVWSARWVSRDLEPVALRGHGDGRAMVVLRMRVSRGRRVARLRRDSIPRRMSRTVLACRGSKLIMGAAWHARSGLGPRQSFNVA